ncbi:tetratricopeptide repeat protein [Paracoccaceae bacterium]|jgi:protein O-GlcNAc transferase|nr:tetratricopeptide repeat protein [Paracoccaceae bacterium]
MAKISIQKLMTKARSLEKKGERAKAKKLYHEILNAFPQNKNARNSLKLLSKSDLNDEKAKPPQSSINYLVDLYNSHDMSKLLTETGTLIHKYPKSYELWNFLGVANRSLNNVNAALEAFEQTVELNPAYAEGFNNLGVLFKKTNQLKRAVEAYKKAILLKPDYATAYNNLGNVFQEQGRTDNAYEAYKKAISLRPDYATAWNNFSVALKDRGDLEESIKAVKTAIQINPNYAEAHNTLGVVLNRFGEFSEAVGAYKVAISLKPDNAEAYNNIANSLQKLGQLEQAIEYLKKALSLNPRFAEAFNSLGNIFNEQNKLKQAFEAYEKSVSINPDYADAWNNIGNNLKAQGKIEEAINAYKSVLTIAPYFDGAKAAMLHLHSQMCDWEPLVNASEEIPKLGILKERLAPWCLLALEDAPQRHLQRSQLYAQKTFNSVVLNSITKPHSKPDKLRIGYFSADFHNFPGMYLMAGMLEAHDRSKFEIFAFSYGPDRSDEMRKRIISAVDEFIDIQHLNSKQVYDCVRDFDIDIAIHRNGYTQRSRTELFCDKLAPIQINYLGYPGSLGAEFMDYIIADRVLIPADKEQFYQEKVIRLPNSYQPNDNKRLIANTTTTASDFNLPEDVFVFCCFNNNYKISPKEFDIWMRILLKTGDSVLWLLKSNKWAEKNLKIEAEKRGVWGDRLIFAEKINHSEHLARHKHADLVIDTFNYNAHTTASDALWAGVPVVSKLGDGFAARVGGSLLTALNLSELLVDSEEAYERLILDLATNPKKLNKIKKKLAENRLSAPLFNTEMYTKNLETGYMKAYELYFEGKTPKTFDV